MPTKKSRNTKTRTKPAATRAARKDKGSLVKLSNMLNVELNLIEPDPKNRQQTTRLLLTELADSIRTHGVLQPICLRPHPDAKRGKPYMIVCGERRWRAAAMAKLKDIPAIVRAFADDKAVVLAQTIENLQREDPNAIEVAQQLQRLRDDVRIPVNQIPDKLAECGLKQMSRSYVSNTLRLLLLPDWAKDLISAGKLTPKHGLALLVAADVPDVMAMLKKELKDGSSRDISHQVRECFERLYPNANNRHGYSYISGVNKIAVLYDAKKYAEKDSSLNLRTVHLDNGCTQTFILNRDLHAKLQKEAAAKIEAAEAKRAAKEAKGKKASKKTPDVRLPAEHKLRDHLSAFIRRHPALQVNRFTTDLINQLVLWLALHAPDYMRPDSGYFENNHVRVREPLHSSQAKAAARLKLTDLQSILQKSSAATVTNDFAQAATAAVAAMDFDNLRDLCDHIGFDLATEYRIDSQYVAMHVTATLERICSEGGDDICRDPAFLTARKKAGTLREYVVAHAQLLHQRLGMPTDLAEIWAGAKRSDQDRAEALEDAMYSVDFDGDENDSDDEAPGAKAA